MDFLMIKTTFIS